MANKLAACSAPQWSARAPVFVASRAESILTLFFYTFVFSASCCRDFKATLDYVLYTRDSLAPSGLLELPSDAEVMSKPGDSLPNANWSSDHVCLMAEFQLLPHKNS